MDILKILQSLQTDKSFAEQGGGMNAQQNLAQLLGFQDQGQDPVMGEGNVDPRTIEVAASNPQQRGQMQTVTEDQPLRLGNVDLLLEAQAAGENAPQRKGGYFGTKGTLRNILGTLSDAFLVQGGADARYAPLREREKMADAMTGYTQNPQAAAERMAYQGFPQESSKVWNDSQVNRVNQGNLDARTTEGNRKLAEDNDQRYKQYGTIFSQYAGSADAATYPKVREILKTLKQRGGLGEEFIVPDEYDPQLMRTYQYGGMPATNQIRSVDKNEDQAWDKEKFNRAEAGRNRRDNPPASRQPRSQTEMEYFKEIGNVPEAKRTQAQKDFYKKYTQGTRGSGRSSGRREVTPTSSFKGWTSSPRQ